MLFKYTATIRIEAHGEFPIDMLRYDQCYPEHGSHQILSCTYGKSRDVEVCRVVDSAWYGKSWEPFTYRRWASFVCPVLKVTKQKRVKGEGWRSEEILVWTNRPYVDIDGRMFTKAQLAR